jgi:hypothetical protein
MQPLLDLVDDGDLAAGPSDPKPQAAERTIAPNRVTWSRTLMLDERALIPAHYGAPLRPVRRGLSPYK